MPTVGILGASGYMGGEALRILLDHPEVEVADAGVVAVRLEGAEGNAAGGYAAYALGGGMPMPP